MVLVAVVCLWHLATLLDTAVAYHAAVLICAMACHVII